VSLPKEFEKRTRAKLKDGVSEARAVTRIGPSVSEVNNTGRSNINCAHHIHLTNLCKSFAFQSYVVDGGPPLEIKDLLPGHVSSNGVIDQS
jgi:hypothetical protein